jgi:tetratricopeptide (TPR) repeat protein
MILRIPLLATLVLAAAAGLAGTVDDCTSADPWADPAATAQICAAALTDQPDDPIPVLLNLGIAQRELGQLAASQDSLSQAVALDPTDPALLHQLGWTLRLLGDYPGAEQNLRQALTLWDDWRTSLSLCVVLQDQAQDARSIPPCQTALASGGVNLDTTYFLARAYNRTARPAEALATAAQGLSLPDPRPRIYVEAAQAHWSLGSHPDAIKVIRQGLNRYPFDRLLLQRLVRFPMFDD